MMHKYYVLKVRNSLIVLPLRSDMKHFVWHVKSEVVLYAKCGLGSVTNKSIWPWIRSYLRGFDQGGCVDGFHT